MHTLQSGENLQARQQITVINTSLWCKIPYSLTDFICISLRGCSTDQYSHLIANSGISYKLINTIQANHLRNKIQKKKQHTCTRMELALHMKSLDFAWMSASIIPWGISGPNQGQMHHRLQGISCFKQKWFYNHTSQACSLNQHLAIRKPTKEINCNKSEAK